MVISRRVLRRNRLRPRLLGFDSREDLSHPCTTVYALALLVQMSNNVPSHLEHRAPSWACVISLTVPPLLVADQERPRLRCPLLERRVARIMVGTGDLLELDAHDSLSAMRPSLGLPHPAPACRGAGLFARVEHGGSRT